VLESGKKDQKKADALKVFLKIKIILLICFAG